MSATVLRFEKFAPAKPDPHLSGEARCLTCGHDWVATAPVGTSWLECESCHSHKGHFLHPVSRDEDHTLCNSCGSHLFSRSTSGFYCVSCGDPQQ